MVLQLDPVTRPAGVSWGGTIEIGIFSSVDSPRFAQVNATHVTVSGWWRVVPVESFGAALLILRDLNLGPAGLGQIILAFDTPTEPLFRPFLWTDSVGNIGSIDLLTGTIPGIGIEQWAHIAFALDIPGLTALMFVNGAPVNLGFTGEQTPINFPINTMILTSYFVNASVPSQRMGVAQLQVWDKFINLSLPTNLQRFYRSGKRVDPQVAEGAFGTPLLSYRGSKVGFLSNRGTLGDVADLVASGDTETIAEPEKFSEE